MIGEAAASLARLCFTAEFASKSKFELSIWGQRRKDSQPDCEDDDAQRCRSAPWSPLSELVWRGKNSYSTHPTSNTICRLHYVVFGSQWVDDNSGDYYSERQEEEKTWLRYSTLGQTEASQCRTMAERQSVTADGWSCVTRSVLAPRLFMLTFQSIEAKKRCLFISSTPSGPAPIKYKPHRTTVYCSCCCTQTGLDWTETDCKISVSSSVVKVVYLIYNI